MAKSDKRDKTHLQIKRDPGMTCYRVRPPAAFVLILCFVCSAQSGAWAQTAPITKDMQTYCVNDYKKFCGDYGLQTKALTNCMMRAGPGLSPACVNALVAAGQVSQAQVDRIKQQVKGRKEAGLGN
ncbi:MAG: hypothetical protein WB662_05515 [Methyloceanibacter sp.]